MNKPDSMRLLIRTAAALGAVSLLVCGLSLSVRAADEKKETAKKPASAEAKKKKLTGAELYALHCNRCHNERYATEFTAAQWKTIMAEMRVRANIPAGQAKAILKYLQEDSGTPCTFAQT